MQLPQQRIILALDVDSREAALELVHMLKGFVGFFKVGLELLNSVSITIVQEITKLGGKVFLDGKFHDIPNTVAGASRAVTRSGVSMFNVHTMGGMQMMKFAAIAAGEESSKLEIERPAILGVTILTSVDQGILNQQLGLTGDLEAQVVHLAELAEEAGLDGVIASPHEIESIRKHVSKQMLVVTPGVRPTWATAQDQKRIMTPGEAILRGASYLVIGRPITKPPAEIGTPVDAARQVAEEIASALAKQEAK